jgi:hypothetical protein
MSNPTATAAPATSRGAHRPARARGRTATTVRQRPFRPLHECLAIGYGCDITLRAMRR